MSALYRSPIFFLTTLKAGWRLALGAMFVESIFRAITSGFYGAITQAVRRMRPAWVAVVIISVILPLLVTGLEYVVHWWRGTPNLRASIIASILITAMAGLFNLYAMRHGTLVTGSEGKSFLADLKSLPKVIAGFLAAGPLALWRVVRRPSSKPV